MKSHDSFWSRLRWVALPAAVLFLALGTKPASAVLVTYNFEADIVDVSTSATILGLTMPSGTITGTLSYDKDAAPNQTANDPFLNVWQNNLGAGQLSINVDGSTISTVAGQLDAAAYNLGGQYSLTFGAQIDASGGIASGPNLLELDGNPVGNQATVAISFSSDLNPQSAGTLDFDLMPDSQWEGTAHPTLSLFPELSFLVGGSNGGSVVAENVRLSLPSNNDPIPEPSSIAIWSLLSAIGVGVAFLHKRRFRDGSSRS